MSAQLVALQRWMMAVISHPHGVEAGIESPAARRYLELGASQLDQVVNPSQTQTSAERLGVYSHAYFARLIECLAAEYPALAYAVGNETFGGFVVEYLRQHPPSSYTLGELGKDFAEILKQTRPPRVSGDSTADWADFLIDLATLERVYAEVFDGPGEETLPVLNGDALKMIPADLWAEIVLETSHSMRLLTLQFPVQNYITTVRHLKPESERIELPSPEQTFLLVHRRDFIVRRRPLSQVQFFLLKSLQAGLSLESAMSQALYECSAEIEFAPQQLQHWFRDWTASGLFRAVHVPK